MQQPSPTLPTHGRWMPAPAQALWFMNTPLGFLDASRAKLGPSFTLQLPGDPLRIVVSQPELIADILALPDDVFRYDTQSFPIDMGRTSILFQDGDAHRATRAVLMPAMHGAALTIYGRQMLEEADREIDRWTPGEMPLFDAMRRLTMAVFLRTVFGVDDDEEAAELGTVFLDWAEAHLRPSSMLMAMALSPQGMRNHLADLSDELAEGRASWRHAMPWGALAKRKQAIIERLQREIDRCRREGDDTRLDVLALLVRSTTTEGRPLGDRDIIDQLVTILVGGYETTSQALCWTVHLLLAHEHALARAHDEVRDGVDPDDRRGFPWIDACVKEALRLRPIAPVVNRHLKAPVVVGGQEVPAGHILWPCSYLVQRDPQLWAEPDAFWPERWLIAPRVPTAHYFPWGVGERRCLGMAFATLELRIVLARLLQRVRLHQPRPEESTPVFRGISIGARDGVTVYVDDVREAR